MQQLPIEIVNKILIYVGELNDTTIIAQYHPSSNQEHYKINFDSDLLWRIKAMLRMKQLYPIGSYDFSNRDIVELYKCGISHYEKQLRLSNKK